LWGGFGNHLGWVGSKAVKIHGLDSKTCEKNFIVKILKQQKKFHSLVGI
jgi:hypothetical protein